MATEHRYCVTINPAISYQIIVVAKSEQDAIKKIYRKIRQSPDFCGIFNDTIAEKVEENPNADNG